MSQGYLELLRKWGLTFFERYRQYLKISAVLLSFAIPFVLLYNIDAYSFNETWKGRTFYMFFLWLMMLELVLGWEEFKSKTSESLSLMRKIFFCITLLIPTLYVIVANYFGLNAAILDLSMQFSVPLLNWMPLAIEYLVFAATFAVIVLIAYRFDGLRMFSISAFFVGLIGTIYLIDNLFPQGEFTPFQMFVPTTAFFAANFLNLIGYQTSFPPPQQGMPVLSVSNQVGSASFSIAWPCSGVQSLLIYTVVMLLFLKKTSIPLIQKVIYFAVGAVVTYFVNILRIATIFVIAINRGDYLLFHNYYGELYSMTWIIAYPLLIIGSRMLWQRLTTTSPGGLRGRLFHRPTLQDSESKA